MPNPVVVLPGYYGSKLVTVPTTKLIWIDKNAFLSPKQIMNRLHLSSQTWNDLVSSGILDQVNLLPFINLDIYKKLIKFLKRDLGISSDRIHSFHYDWRKSFEEAMESLKDVINALKLKTGAKQVTLLTHSFGGIVARAYLKKYGGGSVDWLITMGTPHKGMLKTFEALTEGIKLYRFSKEMIRDASRTCPSAYELVPQEAEDGMYVLNKRFKSAVKSDAWCKSSKMTKWRKKAHDNIEGLLSNKIPVNACFIYGTRIRMKSIGIADSNGLIRFSEREAGDKTVPRVSGMGKGITGEKILYRYPIPYAPHMSIFDDDFSKNALKQILLEGKLPAITFTAKFRRTNLFKLGMINKLAAELRTSDGSIIPGGKVTLQVTKPWKESYLVPQRDKEDYTLNVQMPKERKRFHCLVKAEVPGIEKPFVVPIKLKPF